ncbi:sulfur carrier protein ThiS [Azohydromonas lata]|uniref:MoaD/ThiS family protein n=1 Tax=Azohydromonas lata TaxID=45677 RepID=A0ABU5IJ85_9BURK|nr:MoaD/ThiS family protein [Azohydromonas lata]MDZ5458962.1 MoaD/ThiS family protein [Azohydromonas lata]
MSSEATTSRIEIQLDGAPHHVAPCTLAELIAQLGHAPEGVGTALNGRFVPRTQRERPLQSGDAVLLFKPIVGG